MDSATVVESLRRRIEDTLRPLVRSAEKVALVELPNHGNVGDSAIYLGELVCLASLGLPRPRFICDFGTYNRTELARCIGPNGLILLTGGGSFGDVWPALQERREEIIRSFPVNPIIQLPQTIHFGRSDTLRNARRILNAHPNLTLLVRDLRSLEIARNEFRAPSMICPDMAFSLGPLTRPGPAGRPVLWLLRTDKTGVVEAPRAADGARADWPDERTMLLRKVIYPVTVACRRDRPSRFVRPLMTRLYARLARQRLQRGLRILASGHVVVTDRLHGHILSLLLGIPHVLLDNSYGKLSSFYETWTTDVDDVRWADSSAEALAHATDLSA